MVKAARHLVSVLAVLGLSALLASQVGAQTPPAPRDAEVTEVDEVVVLGLPLDEQVERFVDEVTGPPPGRNPSRWRPQSRICVSVVNLRHNLAQTIIDRVAEVALELGLRAGEPGCSPNVLIVATEDGSQLARALVTQSPNAFRPFYAGAAGSQRDLELFQSVERPIRWWHVSMPLDAETGLPAVRLPGEDRPRYVRGSGRLNTLVQNALLRAYVIIDIDDVTNLTLRQLADFVSMTVFAQINPNADLSSFPSILNVLQDPAIASAMTEWDEGYLQALYDVEMNRRTPAAQAGAIAARLLSRQQAAVEPSGTDEPD
jgi:hypothetical protein